MLSMKVFRTQGLGFKWITVDCVTKRVKAQNTANFPLAGALHCTFTHCAVGFKC